MLSFSAGVFHKNDLTLLMARSESKSNSAYFGFTENYTEMLSIFKLPFKGRTLTISGPSFLPGLAIHLIRNRLKSGKPVDDISQLADATMRELESMQQEVNEAPPEDQYEVMVAALRRIEEELD